MVVDGTDVVSVVVVSVIGVLVAVVSGDVADVEYTILEETPGVLVIEDGVVLSWPLSPSGLLSGLTRGVVELMSGILE